MRVPKLKTLFDECDWQPFFSYHVPHKFTWDEEIRPKAVETKYAGHVCGSGLADAQYIDSRTIKDGMRWDETGELITKNTPA